MKTPTVRLIALGRAGSRQGYGTRRLMAGDEFEERRDVADILVRTGRAKLAPEPAKVADIPPEPAEQHNSIDDLRDEAEALGVDVDRRWGVARLQAEIAHAKRP